MIILPVPRTTREAFAPEIVTPAETSSWWVRLARWITDRHRIRCSMRELHRLDDRVLGDMGLSRCGIEYVSWFGRD